MIDLSLNEVESLALKAARGAGYPWGLAEEIAVAARELAVGGWCWDRALVALLDSEAAGADADTCPIRLGCLLLDQQSLPAETASLRARLPFWLLPFARRLGRALGTPLDVQARGSTDTFWGPLGEHALEPDRIYQVGLKRRSEAPASRFAQVRAACAPDLYARLAAFEALTYVPASAQSRIAGAGAGLSDND